MFWRILTENKAVFGLFILMNVCAVIAIYLSFVPIDATNVSSATGLATSLKYLHCVVGVCLWFVFLRFSDYIAGIKFTESYASIETNALALALYFGLRSLGVGVLLGMVLS
jgi:hypothetical protein